jgi:hypothetical protein
MGGDWTSRYGWLQVLNFRRDSLIALARVTKGFKQSHIYGSNPETVSQLSLLIDFIA